MLARVWMRLITTEPEFSWAGTLAIIGLAAVLGCGVGLVAESRRAGRSLWWTLAVVPGLALFLSPGMLLAPCFLVGALAFAGRGRVLRAVGWTGIGLSVVARRAARLPRAGAGHPADARSGHRLRRRLRADGDESGLGRLTRLASPHSSVDHGAHEGQVARGAHGASSNRTRPNVTRGSPLTRSNRDLVVTGRVGLHDGHEAGLVRLEQRSRFPDRTI